MTQDERKGKNGGSKAPRLHAGHRQRMFAKLQRGELCEHELLETLLFFAIPQKNTNELAHRLLFEFGSPRAVLEADAKRLERVEDVGKNIANFLQCVGELARLCWGNGKSIFPRAFNRDAFKAYMKKEYAGVKEEAFDIYLLDDDGKIFARKRYACGLNEKVELPSTWMQKILVEEQPTGIVLVHTHPIGEPEPSQSDHLATKKCHAICTSAHVVLCEHYIYSPKGIFSYYETGMIRRIGEMFETTNEVCPEL